MSTESKEPFSVPSSDRQIKIKGGTLYVAVAMLIGGALIGDRANRKLDTLSATVDALSATVQDLTAEQRVVGRKVDRLEWTQNGRQGPPPSVTSVP